MKKPRGICLLSESFPPCLDGGAIHSLSLARGFEAAGLQVTVITRRNDPSMPSLEMMGRWPVIRVGPDDGLGRLGRYLALFSVLGPLFFRRHDYHLLLVSNLRILGVPAVLLARLLGKICILRTDSQGEMTGSYAVEGLPQGSLRRSLATAYFRIRNAVLRQADAHLAISRAVLEEFHAAGLTEKTALLLPNGIDTTRFTPVDEAEKQAIRQRLKLPAVAILVIYTGRITREKGLEFLVRVWKAIQTRCPDSHLLLVGPGEGLPLSCEQEVRTFISEHHLGRSVTLTGAVSEVQPYLQAADLFVFPSRTEALGLALMEAMACGLPAVGSAVGGIPDLISHGESGRLLAPEDEAGWVEAVVQLMEHPEERHRMGLSGRQIVVSRFDLSVILRRYLALFGRLERGEEVGSVEDGRPTP